MNNQWKGIILGGGLILLAIAGIFYLRSSHPTPDTQKPVLRIGYLPITHAALPLVVEAKNNGKLQNFDLEMVRFSNWAELAEALQAGKIDGGGDILNNLAFKIVEKGVPLQNILMAVRAGSALTVSSAIHTPAELKGKTIAIPSRFSPHYILLYRYLADNGLDIATDVTTIDMAPSDMVQALGAKSIDGFIVAEPFNAQAEEMGIGKTLVLSRDIVIPGAKNLECGITLRKDFIDRHPEAVQEFVEEMIQAGIWIDENPDEAANLIAPLIGQQPETVLHTLIDPPGRTRFTDLYPRLEEFEALQDAMLSLGLLDSKIDMAAFVEEKFAEQAYTKFGLKKQDW